MFAAQKIFVQHFGRVDTALFCPLFGTEKETVLKMSA
jgi:hypothetical protein